MTARTFVQHDDLEARLLARLLEAGASEASARASVRAMMHASRVGVDSHGARLIGYYVDTLRDGISNRSPNLAVRRSGPATAVVDGDNGLGHYASYRAMEEAVEIAREAGIGAVGVIRSSHFGAAGAYALAAAEAGMFGFATTNSDSLVALFGGAAPFHGTNPLAFAAPSGGERPWLIDMATSSIPFNRVLLYRSLGTELPAGVAADASGAPTRDPADAAMLLPLGGTDYGFKGAALAGLATVLSGVLQGMAMDPNIPDGARASREKLNLGVGQFFLAIDPARFGGTSIFIDGMRAYLAALRGARTRPGETVMAPGDREWKVEKQRAAEGIPLDPETAAFLGY